MNWKWVWLEKIKWTSATVGWPIAFVFWFQIIVVLYASHGLMSQFSLYIFHFLWIIITCTFFSATFTPPESAKKVHPGITEVQKNMNYCDTCEYPKPKRWHHCRRCGRCVHRMDHHCPILQMCIHSKNHKFFLLFLFWPLFLAVFTLYHGYSHLWKGIRSAFTGEEVTVEENVMSTGVSNALMVGVAATYLLYTQLPNLFRNQTLIEESRDTTKYNLGNWLKNYEVVMGPWRYSLLPISTETKED